jgi:hypothetical protein
LPSLARPMKVVNITEVTPGRIGSQTPVPKEHDCFSKWIYGMPLGIET